MKKTAKVLCVFLAVMMCFPCVIPAFAAEENSLKVTVATDIHFAAASSYGDVSLYDSYSAENPYWYYVNDGQADLESEAILRSMLDSFISSDSDVLFLGGDFTNGIRADHEAMSAILSAAEKSSGKRIFVVPGNHDIDPASPENFNTPEEFRDCYYEFGFSEALCEDENSLSYTADIDDTYRLIAIDSCVYGETDGFVSDSVLNWIMTQAQTAKEDGKVLIAMMHHPVLPHFVLQPMADNYSAVADILAASGIKYVFTGHIHSGEISSAVTSSGKLYDVMTSSLVSYPCAYREVEFSADSTVFTQKYVTSVDTSYLPAGMNSTQLSLIDNDFGAYIKGYLGAYMKNWILNNIGSADKAAASLGLERGSFAYSALNEVMSTLGEALSLPLYNTDSTPGEFDTIQEIAGAYGYALPDTDYYDIFEAAADIMGSFYLGDGAINPDSPEMKLVYSAVNSALSYTVNKILQRDVMSEPMAELAHKLNIAVAKNDYLFPLSKFLVSRRYANALTGAVLGSLTGGIIGDTYTPANNDVTLEGYENTENTSTVSYAPLSFLQKVTAFFRTFFERFISFFR